MFSLIKQFLKPDRRKVFIFLILLLFTFVGYIAMGSMLIDGAGAGPFERFLRNIHFPLPFLIVGLFLMFSVLYLCNFFGLNNVTSSPWFFLIIILICFYLFSCLIIFIWDKIFKKT